jgi:hypothetical protein
VPERSTPTLTGAGGKLVRAAEVIALNGHLLEDAFAGRSVAIAMPYFTRRIFTVMPSISNDRKKMSREVVWRRVADRARRK